MAELRAIDGSKRAKAIAEATIKQCACGSREVVETRTGVLVGKDGRVLHKGTIGYRCAICAKQLA